MATLPGTVLSYKSITKVHVAQSYSILLHPPMGYGVVERQGSVKAKNNVTGREPWSSGYGRRLTF